MDLREKSVNKVTINMYDKELMPVVDELYMHDQSMSLLAMKQEGKQEEVSSVFDQFVQEIENSISEVMNDGEYYNETKDCYRSNMEQDFENQACVSFHNSSGLE